MIKTKVIRGRPNYVYHKCNYLEQPEKTVVSKMLYDEENNVTNIYCKRPKKIIEFLSTVVIVTCVVMNVMFIHKMSIDVYYNNMATYYNNQLYLNLKSSEDNIVNIQYTLNYNGNKVCSGIIEPGETIISIPIDNIKDTYTLKLEYYSITGIKSEDVNITVIDRSK